MNMQDQDNYKTFEANYKKRLNLSAKRANDLLDSIPFIKDTILKGMALEQLDKVLEDNLQLTAAMEAQKDER